MQVGDFDHHLECLAEKKITHEHARLVAPQHSGGDFAAPHAAFIDNVVVQQRRRVHEFDRRSELDMAVAGVACEPCHGEGQHWTQPLASGGN